MDKKQTRTLLLSGVIALVGVFLLSFVVDIKQPHWYRIIESHFAAVVGLPFAGVAAFLLVTILRQAHGPIEFEGFGFKFRGASGPIVMWTLAFSAMAAAIKLLW